MTREEIIAHILKIMKIDIDYARAALRYYHDLLPDLDLLAGVREAMKTQEAA